MNGKIAMNEVFNEYLQKDEEILWAGQPDPSVMVNRADIMAIPFSIVWCSISILGEAMAITDFPDGSSTMGEHIFNVTWGAAFVLAGFYMVYGRFI